MHETHFLYDVIILLAAAVCMVIIFRSLRLSPVLGYLVAGAMIGPYGLSIIPKVHSGIAEMGVVFLLFVIGLELSMDRLREMRAYVFGYGTLQVLLTSGLIGGIVWLVTAGNIELAILLGGALAFSSTAIVLQVLSEGGEKSGQVSRVALATLLFQDFAVVPMLVLVPLLASEDIASIGGALMGAAQQALLVMVAMFIAGRLLLRPLFRMIVRTQSRELFVAATLLIVLGASFATEQAGLSLALGAFLAGLLLAETEYEHQVEADILPFKGLFLSLFFMTIGMSINLPLIIQQWPVILGLAALLMAIKALVLFLLCRLFRFSLPCSIRTAFVMAQGSEFAFVLFGLGLTHGLLEVGVAQLLFVVVSLTMALTPLMDLAGIHLARWITRHGRRDDGLQINAAETADLDHHVIISGYGRMGQVSARILEAAHQPYIILDLNPRTVAEGRKAGYPVYYGDATRSEVLRSVGAERADALLLTYSGTQRVAKAIRAIHHAFPSLRIVARADGEEEATIMRSMGADLIVKEALETGLQLGGALLRSRGTAEEEIRRVLEALRADRSHMPT